MPRPVRIRAVEPLEEFKVRLEFTDNTTKEMDLKPYLHGPIFEPIRNDLQVFRSVKVDPRMGRSCGITGPTSIRMFCIKV